MNLSYNISEVAPVRNHGAIYCRIRAITQRHTIKGEGYDRLAECSIRPQRL